MILNHYLKKNDKGFVLLWSMIAMSLLFVIATSLVVLMINEIKQTQMIDESTQAYQATEAGLERAGHYIAQGDTLLPINQTQVSGQRVSATRNDITYSFQVVRATPGGTPYDSVPGPSSSCTTAGGRNACFFVEGRAGNIVRKYMGSSTDISLGQGTTTDFSTMQNGPVTAPPTPPPPFISQIDMTPSDIPTSENIFLLKGDMRFANNSVRNNDSFRLGMLDRWSVGPIGVGIEVIRGTDTTVVPNIPNQELLKLQDVLMQSGIANIDKVRYRNLNQSLPSTPLTRTINITPSVALGEAYGNDITFELTYRNAPVNDTVTLRATNRSSGRCLGILTAYYPFDMAPRDAFFTYGRQGVTFYSNLKKPSALGGVLTLHSASQTSSGGAGTPGKIEISNLFYQIKER